MYSGGRNHPLQSTSQKKYLEDYAVQHGFGNIQHFSDDGYSGTNFNRPAFNSLLTEIEAGRVGTVIVKDMSRFGRNYLQVGFYTETLWTRAQKADRETGCWQQIKAEYQAPGKCGIFSLFCCQGFPKGLAPWHTTLLAKCSVLYALSALPWKRHCRRIGQGHLKRQENRLGFVGGCCHKCGAGFNSR